MCLDFCISGPIELEKKNHIMEYHLQPIPVVLGSHVQNAFKAVDLWVCTVGMTMS